MFRIHKFRENKFFQEIALHVFKIVRTRVDRKTVGRFKSSGDNFIHDFVNRVNHFKAERRHKMAAAIDGNKIRCSDGIAEQHERFQNFGFGFALVSVQDCNFFGCELHFVIHNLPPISFIIFIITQKREN